MPLTITLHDRGGQFDLPVDAIAEFRPYRADPTKTYIRLKPETATTNYRIVDESCAIIRELMSKG